MTRYATKNCDCPEVVTGTGGRRPDFCEPHRERFYTEKELQKLHPAPVGEGDVRALRSGGPVADPSGGGASNAGRRRRKSSKRSGGPPRDWSLARTKVEEEACCRICKRTDRKLDAAHVLGREHDEPKVGTNGQPLKELFVHPDRIIPACGPYPEGCHGAMHRHEVDVLRYLTVEEQVRAVLDAGSLEAAHIRLTSTVERSAAA